MIAPKWATNARTNWRSGLWIAVAILAFALAIGASAYARNGIAPSESEKTARHFLADWNKADYRQAFAYLDTSIAPDSFVDAMTHTAAPLRDARVERVVQQDDRHATIAYSASVPDPVSAAAGIVVANPSRYAASCVAANLRGARYVRVTDTLVLDRGSGGAWKIGFRASAGSQGSGAAALGLALDLAPQSVFARTSAGSDPRSNAYDDQAITQALAIYKTDAGALPIEDPGDSSPDVAKIRVNGVGQACGLVSPTA